MKHRPLFSTLFTSLIIISVSSIAFPPASAATYTNITVIQAKEMIDSSPSLFVLDVRNESEYVTGHIRNAKLIPLYQLTARLDELNATDTILAYCGIGGRSQQASEILSTNGFMHVYNMLGGMTDWIREQYPTYVKYVSIQEAINNATDGSVLYVGTGQYFEHLVVNKSLSLVGENRENTIVDGSANGTIFYIKADNVSISDFRLQYCGCGCAGYCAVDVENNHQNINVTNDVIVSDGIGIRLNATRKALIAYNNISRNTDSSMIIADSSEIAVNENLIADNMDGIEVLNATLCVFINNNITSSVNAISMVASNKNTITGNIFASNAIYGLYLSQSSNNTIINNNFVGNGRHASLRNSSNLWDDDFEGNYWSNYTGTDTDNDGIGNSPHAIDANNTDNRPLLGRFHSYPVSSENTVNVITNSTINDFEIPQKNAVILHVSNTTVDQTIGFCRIAIPHTLIDPYTATIQVTIDNNQTQVLYLNTTLYDNGTYRWIYFTYPHSTHEIVIVPEHTMFLIALAVLTGATLAGMVKRRRGKKMLTF